MKFNKAETAKLVASGFKLEDDGWYYKNTLPICKDRLGMEKVFQVFDDRVAITDLNFAAIDDAIAYIDRIEKPTAKDLAKALSDLILAYEQGTPDNVELAIIEGANVLQRWNGVE